MTGIRRLSSCARRRTGSALSLLPIVLAIAMSVLSCLGWGLLYANRQGAWMRDGARTPLVVEEEADAALLWGADLDTVGVDHRSSVTIYLEPLREGAPLPPGLDRWPEPGESFLSPALLESGRTTGIETRYGRYAGTIGYEGLASSDELLAYVRPAEGQAVVTGSFLKVAGFGARLGAAGPDSTGMTLSSSVDPLPLTMRLVFHGFFCGLGAALLCVTAARFGLERRRGQNLMLCTLGYSLRERVAWQWAQIRVAFVAGVALAAAMLAVALRLDLYVPFMGVTLWAGDARSCLPLLISLCTVPILLFAVYCIAAAVRRPTALAANRPLDRSRQYGRIRACIGLFAIPVAAVLSLAAQQVGTGVVMALYLGSLATLLLCVRDMVGWCVQLVCRAVRTRALARNDAAATVASAGLLSYSGATVGFSALICTVMVVGCQFYAVTNQAAGEVYDGRMAYASLYDRVVEVQLNPRMDSGQLRVVVDALRTIPSAELSAFGRYPSSRSAADTDLVVGGSDHALADALDSGTGSGSLWSQYLRFRGYADSAYRTEVVGFERFLDDYAARAPESRGSAVIVVTSADGGTVDADGVKEALGTRIAPLRRVDGVGAAEVGVTASTARATRWIAWSECLALAMVVMGMLITLVAEAFAVASRLAPLGVLAGAPSVTGGVTAWRLAVPAAVGVLTGGALAACMTTVTAVGLRTPQEQVMPIIGGSAMLAIVICAVSCVASSAYVNTRSIHWKAGRS